MTPQLSGSTEFALGLVSIGTAGLSCLFALVVVCLCIALHLHKETRKSMDRFSLRILMQFEIVSIPYAISSILAITLTTPGKICTLTAYIQALLVMVMNGLIALISLNFVVFLVFNIQKSYEKRLILTVWIAALCSATPSLLLGYFGYDPVQEVCWITLESSPYRVGIEMVSAMALCYVFTVLSTISCIVVIHHLRHRYLAGFELDSIENNLQRHRTSRRVVLRIMLFPCLSILMNGFVISTILVAETLGVPIIVSFISQLLLNCPGAVYATIMLSLDPSFARSVQKLFRHETADSGTLSTSQIETYGRDGVSLQMPSEAAQVTRRSVVVRSRESIELAALIDERY